MAHKLVTLSPSASNKVRQFGFINDLNVEEAACYLVSTGLDHVTVAGFVARDDLPAPAELGIVLGDAREALGRAAELARCSDMEGLADGLRAVLELVKTLAAPERETIAAALTEVTT